MWVAAVVADVHFLFQLCWRHYLQIYCQFLEQVELEWSKCQISDEWQLLGSFDVEIHKFSSASTTILLLILKIIKQISNKIATTIKHTLINLILQNFTFLNNSPIPNTLHQEPTITPHISYRWYNPTSIYTTTIKYYFRYSYQI